MKDRDLARLCRAHGIATAYRDSEGQRRVVSSETARVLLAAMGVAAQTPAQVRASLQAALARHWQRWLEPVQVLRAGEPVQVTLTLPFRPRGRPIPWAVEEESGHRHEGILRTADLEVLEQGQAGGRRYARYRFPVPLSLPEGYHRLQVGEEGPGAAGSGGETRLIASPGVCYRPAALEGEARIWGVTAALHSLRSPRDWGIGDYRDLTRVVELWAGVGAGLVEVGPLHALFPEEPARADPHAPSSRLFLNLLYLDVEGIADFAECAAAAELVRSPSFQAQLRALRAAEQVQYAELAAAKLQILELLYRSFRAHHLDAGSERGRGFRAYRAEQGEPLERYARFQALREQEATRGDPQAWPAAYRDPRAPAVAAFAAGHRDRIELYQYLQWQADLQLGGAGLRSWELGLAVGICQGLALAPAADGAEAWANPGLFARGVLVGSPPAELNPGGAAWGLAPPIPGRLREEAYGAFVAALRHNMRHAGVLRIDRIAGLQLLLWVPAGGSPQDAAFVRYPFRDLLAIIALESQRNRCLVIADDLGPLPARMGEALAAAGVLSYRLLCLAKDARGDLLPPAEYPPRSLVAASAPALPSLAAYWQGADLDLCARLDLFPSEQHRYDQVIARAQDRARLLVALEREGLLPPGASVDPVRVSEMTAALSRAVHLYLARSSAQLLTIRMEDMLGQAVPSAGAGGGDRYAPWSDRLALDLEQWAEDERVRATIAALRQERGAAGVPRPVPELEPGPPPSGALIPRATYRLQLHRGFTFDDAAALAPYLAGLGVSHCYLSPILRARPGSLHGYDIIDHGAINPDLGGEAGFQRLLAALRQEGLGVVLDLVPNHMGIMGCDNAWWLDLLENGATATAAGFFDVDWAPLKEPLGGKVLVPILGDHYGHVLDRGELRLAFDPQAGAFSLVYYEHRLPIDPREYPLILAPGLGRLEARLGSEHPPLIEFESLLTAFGHLPSRLATDPERLAERQRDKEIHKLHLGRLAREVPDIAWYIEECLREMNGADGYSADPERLHQLLEAQAYQPAYWRVASDDINYRRFFDINDLASLRMERADVFAATHRLVLDLVRRGDVEGLRIDHPDGLYDPQQYFCRVQSMAAGGADAAAGGVRPPAIWLVAEKILAPRERLRESWPVHGTTGYDFANLVSGLLVDARGGSALARIYRAHLGETPNPDEILYQGKRLIMKSAMAGELNVLANQLSRIAEADRRTRDYTLNSLRGALAEVVACFPVYRTYITESGPSPEDREYIEWAIAAAKRRSLVADTSVFDFVREVLLLRAAEGKPADYRAQVVTFALKFQQYTAPVQAKGIEDTAFYVYNRLISLNEVGGDPRRFGISTTAFHRANAERARHWPHAMLSTSTHDSKRSEDVRARIHALSELPREWRTHLARWRGANRKHLSTVDGVLAPSRNDQYLLYQTLVGAWPAGPLDEAGLGEFRERIQAYMQKAVREAKVTSSWVNPNVAYEEAVEAFVAALLKDPDGNPFLADFLPFQRRIAYLGMLNSLTQILLKLTLPGVPDTYQGTEVWDFSLVDPDNRRPVDWQRRRTLLAEIRALERRPDAELAPAVHRLLDRYADGRIKLYLLWRLLSVRRNHPALFRDGTYRPLVAQGERAAHALGFTRTHRGLVLAVVASRHFAALTQGGTAAPLGTVWGDTSIEVPPAEDFVNLLTGERLRPEPRKGRDWLDLSELFAQLPFALLMPGS